MDPILILLGIYVVTMGGLMVGIDKTFRTSKEGFMVSNRSAMPWQVALSAAASWTYISVLILNSRFTVQYGFSGVFWYTIVFVAVLIGFGYMGHTLIQRMPKGYTLNEYIDQRYKDRKMTVFYQVLQIAAAIYAVTANLTGFGIISEIISEDFSYNTIIVVLGITVLLYTMWGGIRASHKTDALQFGLLILACVVFGFWSVIAAGGPTTVFENWNTAVPRSMMDPEIIKNFVGLLLLLYTASILADNMHYQNVFSLGNKKKVIKTYWLSGTFLFVAYAGLTMIAASAFSLPIEIKNPDNAYIQVIEHVIGPIGLLSFMLIILFKCSSVMDSSLNGAGTVIANDVIKTKNPLMVSRITMAFVMISAIFLTIMEIDLWVLLTTFGALRILAVAPTLYGVFTKKEINTNVLFYTLIVVGIGAFTAMAMKLPIDRFYLSLIILAIPTSVIIYKHYKT